MSYLCNQNYMASPITMLEEWKNNIKGSAVSFMPL